MSRLSRSVYGWQTVLIGLLVAPVFYSSAELFEPHQRDSNLIVPQHILFYRQQQQRRQQHTTDARHLETLNSRRALSSNDDLMQNTMLNVEKPVDTMHKLHRIERLQRTHETAINTDHFDAKNKDEFFVEDGNEMRSHGQPGNILNRQFIARNAARKSYNPLATRTFGLFGQNGKLTHQENRVQEQEEDKPPQSYAEYLISNLAANNPVVKFSQSASPDFFLPFDPNGTIYSVDGRTKKENENKKVVTAVLTHPPQVILINGTTRIYGAGTESKFPPFLEFFVQRIQKYFSIYKYEDLSRPASPSQMEASQFSSKLEPERLSADVNPSKMSTEANDDDDDGGNSNKEMDTTKATTGK